MKSSVKVLVCGLLASTVVTGPRAVQAHPLTGPFIGLEGDALYGRMKTSSKAKEIPGIAFNKDAQGAFSGGVGGFAGYGFVFDNGFYLGGELNGNVLFGGENKNAFNVLLANRKDGKSTASVEEVKTETSSAKSKKTTPKKETESAEAKKGTEAGKTESAKDLELLSAALVTKPRWSCGTALQLGYAVTPQVIIYGSGGVNLQGVKTSLQVAGQNISDKTKQNLVVMGTVGLGVRYWVTPNAFLGVEAEAMFGRKEKWSTKEANLVKKPSEAKGDAKSAAKLLPAGVKTILESNELNEKMNRQNYGGRLCIGYKF